MQKNTVVTIRLSSDEKKKLDIDAEMVDMKPSQYIRSLITNTELKSNSHQQEIASLLCKIYILLAEENIDASNSLMKELNKLCQTLS